MLDFKLAAESVRTTAGMLGIEMNLLEPVESRDSFVIEDDVIVIIGIVTGQKYNLAFSMADKTARSIAGIMMGAESCEMDEIGRSTIGELVNMISGNIASSCEESGVTLPTVIAGTNVSCVMQSLETAKLKFQTMYGPFEVNIALEG